MITTPTTAATELPPTEAELEHDRGYRAFMLNTGHYALAHAAMCLEGGEGSHEEWEKFADAGHDDRPITAEYLDGWSEAKQRMLRECNVFGFGGINPRESTAIKQWMAAHPGQACQVRHGVPGPADRDTAA
jgi:hypothetical protein